MDKYPKQIAAAFPVELQQSLLSAEDRQWTVQDRGKELVEHCRVGELQAAKELLSQGVHPDSCDELGVTALQAAVAGQHVAIVGLLLSSGAEVDRPNDKGISPLQLACMKGDGALCDAILKHQPHVLKISGDGRIALHYACESGAEECVRKLLMHVPVAHPHANGNDVPNNGVSAQDTEGRTPLHFAIINGHEGIIRRMLQAGADTNASDNQGRTPLDIAEAMNLPPSTLHLLLQHVDKKYHMRKATGDGELSTQEATVIGKLHHQLEEAQSDPRRRNSFPHSDAIAAHADAFVLVDADGCLVEDPSTHRVVLHHLKANAVHYAQQTLRTNDCGVALLEKSKWPEFCRDVLYEWKDDQEEEDPLMAAFMRQQQMMMGSNRGSKSDESSSALSTEQWELEQSILQVTDEIARLHLVCTDAEQRLERLEAENCQITQKIEASRPVFMVDSQFHRAQGVDSHFRSNQLLTSAR